jgi:hypothetical protein
VDSQRLDSIARRLGAACSRREALRALAVLFIGSAMAGRARHSVEAGNRHKPRKRLRKQCRKECNGVHHDCLSVCHSLGYDDDICHPRCSTAKHSCRRGCD